MQSQLKAFFRITSYKCNIVRTLKITSDIKSDEILKSWRDVPGPKSLPIIGQLHHFLPGGELRNFEEPDVLQRLYDKYGPIVRLDGMFGMGGMILISDPEITAYVFRSENLSPNRPSFISLEYYRKNYKKSKGYAVGITGLMTDHGDKWKKLRSSVNHILLQPNTIKLYCTVLDEVAQDMIKRMKTLRDEKYMIQNKFDSEMNLWALESIGTVALGCRLNCLDSTLPDDSPEKQLIQCVQEVLNVAAQLDFKPSFWRYVSTPLFKRGMKLYEQHENLTKHFLKKGLKQLKLNTDQKASHEKGVLEKLLDINEEYALIMASDMLFAGIDTTANLMTAVLYVLAVNQDKQNKLREEIVSNSDRRPYLKACIKEGLRVIPIISGNIRRSTKEYNMMGYRIPKNTNLVFSNGHMSLMEQHYPRAREYIPERWMAEKNDPLYYGQAHPFTYGPFGFGTRSCIGRRIVELEIETFLARVIENFKVEWLGPPPTLSHISFLHFKCPFYFTFKDVK